MNRVIYVQMGKKLFPKGMPSKEVLWDQIQLAQLSTTVYAMLPVLGEFFVEEGYTRCSHYCYEHHWNHESFKRTIEKDT